MRGQVWKTAVVVAATLATPRAFAQRGLGGRVAWHLEAGASVMVSDYQRNADPARYDGNVKGYRLGGFEGSARLAVRLCEPFSLQVSVANWVFASATGEAGWVFAPMAGLRVEPEVGPSGRLWIDGNAGLGFSGLARRFAFDVGIGFEFRLTPAVGLGPTVRYGQMVVPDTLGDGAPVPFSDDARYLAGGVTLTLRPWSSAPSEPAVTPPPEPPLGPPDYDHDGVVDADDHCPVAPAGPSADPSRPGCSLRDLDGDGVFDRDDRCPVVAAGAAPNPDLPGCPDPDNDGDGVTDHRDQCPSEPVGASPDRTRAGCPETDGDGDGLLGAGDRCPAEAETFNHFEDGDGCPDRPPLVTLSEGVIRLLEMINFAPGSDRIIGARSYDICDSLVAILAAHGEIPRVEVQGHTDDRGSEGYNLELSRRRAAAVRQYLVDHGIDPRRVIARGYGASRPRVPNTAPAQRAQNRRVELNILEAHGGAGR